MYEQLVTLPKVSDRRGNLSFAENFNQIPFEIHRLYWIYDVPGGTERGGHAYKENIEFVIALSGSFDVIIDDGNRIEKVSLNRSYYGLLIPKMTWRKMTNFSTNSLALVLSSTEYNPHDYIRDYQDFLKVVKP
jgi:dTDP-4-dehydrorhamnose 3,5-epimerase-like enzyme